MANKLQVTRRDFCTARLFCKLPPGISAHKPGALNAHLYQELLHQKGQEKVQRSWAPRCYSWTNYLELRTIWTFISLASWSATRYKEFILLGGHISSSCALLSVLFCISPSLGNSRNIRKSEAHAFSSRFWKGHQLLVIYYFVSVLLLPETGWNFKREIFFTTCTELFRWFGVLDTLTWVNGWYYILLCIRQLFL